MGGMCTTQKQLTAASNGRDLHYAKELTAASFFHSRSLWFCFVLLAKAKAAKSRTKGTLDL
jgi:hypothetical protein